MEAPPSIANLFLADSALVVAKETFTLGEWEFMGERPVCPSIDAARTVFSSLPSRDGMTIAVAFDSESFSINSKDSERLKDFLDQVRTHIQVGEPGDRVSLRITINKSTDCSILSLYSLDAFVQTLEAKPLREMFGVFAEIARLDANLTIQTIEGTRDFQTKTTLFCPKARSEEKPRRRAELRLKRSELAHFEDDDSAIVPDDFFLVTRSPDERLNALFDKLCFVSCVTFLADISRFRIEGDRETLWFKLNGYRSISGDLDLSAVDPSMVSELHRVYEWVYSGGGLSDKMGLARNIISLHWKGGALPIELGTFNSIRSGFEIYLKQNVRQYIEVKNKLTDFLADFSQKASKLAEALGDKLEKNFIAFVGFFISSVIVKVVTDSSFTGVMTPSLAIIGFTIIGFSSIHLAATVLIFNKDKERLEEDFIALQNRYTDLLDQKDLERIFAKDDGFDKLSKYLKFKRNLFTGVWILSLVFFTSLVLRFTEWHPHKIAPQSPSTNNIAAAAINGNSSSNQTVAVARQFLSANTPPLTGPPLNRGSNASAGSSASPSNLPATPTRRIVP
jgi:hypothetical protein